MYRFSFVLLLLLSADIFSQSTPQPIIGKVLEDKSDTPLAGSTIDIYEGEKKTTIKSDEKGSFIFFTYSNNNVWIEVSHIGFIKVKRYLTLSRDTLLVKMRRAIQTLEKIEITAEKKYLKENAKGLLLDIKQVPGNEKLKIIDALNLIPGISVNRANGTILYLGKPLEIRRNGVSSAGFTNRITNEIRIAEIGEFEQLELSTFDLRSEGPVLNFLKKKNDGIGLNGNSSGGFGLLSNVLRTRLSVVHKKHLLDFNGGYNENRTPKMTGNSLLNMANAISRKSSSEIPSFKTKSYTLGAGYTYSPKNNQTLSLEFSISKTEIKTPSFIQKEIESRNGDFYRSTARSTNHLNNRTGLNAQFNYLLNFKQKNNKITAKSLNLVVEWDQNNISDFMENQSSSEGAEINFNAFRKHQKSNGNNLFTSLGFNYNHKKWGNFELLSKIFTRERTETLDNRFLLSSNQDSATFQDTKITYQYSAVLLSWDKQLTAKNSIRIVLKADRSKDEMFEWRKESFEYSTFSPMVSFLKKMKRKTIRIESRYYQIRPDLRYLSPLIDFSRNSLFERNAGNPNLRPEKNFSTNFVFSAPYKKLQNTLSITHTLKYDGITTFKTTLDSLVINNYINLSRYQQFGFTVNNNVYLSAKFSIDIRNSVTYAIFPNVYTSKSALSYDCSVGGNYWCTPSLSFYSTINIVREQEFQNNRNSRLFLRTGGNFQRGKFTFQFALNNFHQPFLKNKVSREADGYSFRSESKMRNTDANILLFFRFGKSKKQRPNLKKIVKDDI
ncbi:MAG: hypothetical protein ACO1NW_13205 [Chitinophagaceae bacterium]